MVRGEGGLAQEVVLRLVSGLEGKKHVVVTNNYFSIVPLFLESMNQEIYATSTMHSNRLGMLTELKNLREWNRRLQDTLEWQMHLDRGISCVVWKDKCPVFLISTHAMPIQFPCIHPMYITTVLRRNGAKWEIIRTSPIHLEYMMHMQGVDGANVGVLLMPNSIPQVVASCLFLPS
jgi:hypothetical protein